MKLIVSKARPRSARAAPAEKPLKVTFSVESLLDPKDVRFLKQGQVLHLYVNNDGSFGTSGIFGSEPTSEVYSYPDDRVFKDKANYTFKPTGLGKLKGSRLKPAFIEIRKVEAEDGKAELKGLLHNAVDPRLMHLDRSQKTEYGEGTFKLEDVAAFYDGNYLHLALSPYAEEIEKIAQEQKDLFKKFAKDKNDDITKRALEKTEELLKPHAHEIYKIKDDLVYFISDEGKWRLINIAGNRKLDLWDKDRVYDYAKKHDLLDADLREYKENFHKTPLGKRLHLSRMMPLLLDDVLYTREKDAEELEKKIAKNASRKPSDGLEPIPGLKEGTQLLPAQAYMLAMLEDEDREPIDADPGAGKSLVLIADALKKVAKGKAKRPLVIMPNSLLNNFASEVEQFSDFNPWIISTASIKKWKKGDLDQFFEDAKSAPINTLFITSYNWLAYEKEKVENGRIVHGNYETTTVYPRSYRLLNELGVDAVYIDEAHNLKNDSSYTHAASPFSKAPIFRTATGTIMPGNLIDVLGQLGLTHSAVLGTVDEFLDKYAADKTLNQYKDSAPKEIREALKRFGMPQIRSTAWAHTLPKIHRSYHFVEFNAAQEKVYKSLLESSLDEINNTPLLKTMFDRFKLKLEEGEVYMPKGIRDKFQPLDIFLNAPAKAKPYVAALLEGEDAKSPKSKEINRIISEHLAKPDNGKVIVFVQYIASAKNLFDGLDPNLKAQAKMYKGGDADVLSKFKIPESDLKILIGVDPTLRSGHNLQVANCIIHGDTLWLSGDMGQRNARAARNKQTREVFIHHVIVRNSNELLKNARVLSQEHLIAKANSDFEDKTVLPQIEMSSKAMKSFRSIEEFEPFVARQKTLDEFRSQPSAQEKEFFGSRTLAPHRYEKIADAHKLSIVPSTTLFRGDVDDLGNQVSEELAKLPANVETPKKLKFDIQQWKDGRYITCFKAIDPQGFCRRLNFSLMPPYLYIEVPSKGGVSSILEGIEKAGVQIIDKDDLEKSIFDVEVDERGTPGFLKDMEQDSRSAVSGAKQKPKDAQVQIQLEFGTINKKPLLWTKNIKLGTKEGQILKKQGFKEAEAFWYLKTTRGKIVTQFLEKLQHNFPQLKIADWNEFKRLAKDAFKFDLDLFDSLGEDEVK